MRLRILAVVLCIMLAMVACDDLFLGQQDDLVSLHENLLSPPALNDGWDVSDLPAEAIDTARIHQLIRNLQGNPRNIHSMLIIRHHKLVSESYFAGWHRERLHALRSASKSFISTLTGIAVDKKYITIDQKVFDFFPEYAALRNNEKDSIRIKHLLTMTSGLKWNERLPIKDKRNDEINLDRSDDRLAYILGKPMDAAPGTKFVYNSGSPFLQAEILKRATGGQDIVEFSNEHLFKPLGITKFFWRKEEDGQIPAAGPLFLRPRDMAKLGQLFLDGGKWKGTQIVSTQWVNDATATFIGSESDESGYGYNWWTAVESVNDHNVRVYRADGNGGQLIFVIPEFNAVVVFTGGNYDVNYGAPALSGMLTNIILPSMK